MLKNRKHSETIRMILVAFFGAIIGFLTYEIIYFLNPFTHKATSSWFLAFLIGVLRQHALHRHFTFNYKTSYWKSLYRAYILDSGVLVLTSVLNWVLIEVLHWHHRLAWFCCLVVTALVGLGMLKHFVFTKQHIK